MVFANLGGAVFDGLLEEVAEAFDADFAVDGFDEVEIPDFEGYGIAEEV